MAKARVGRPAKAPEEKRQQIGVRTTPELKAQLEAAAGANGRSVAQEAEFRLVRSFTADKVAGGADNENMFSFLGAFIVEIERHTGARWTEDEPTWRIVRDTIVEAVNRRRPGKPESKAFTNFLASNAAPEPLSEEARSFLDAIVKRD